MSDTSPVDLAPEPGDGFIVLRNGVPYIGTEPVKASLDVTDVLTQEVRGTFNPAELRDPHTGKWIRDPHGHFLDPALRELGNGERVSHKGAGSERNSKGYRTWLARGQKPVTYRHAEDAAEAMRRGKHLEPYEMKYGKSHLHGGDPQDVHDKALFDNFARSLGEKDLNAQQLRDVGKEQAKPGSALRKMSDAELKALSQQARLRLYMHRHAGSIQQLVNDERSRRNNAKREPKPSSFKPGDRVTDGTRTGTIETVKPGSRTLSGKDAIGVRWDGTADRGLASHYPEDLKPLTSKTEPKPKPPPKPKADPAQGLSGEPRIGKSGVLASPLEQAFVKEHKAQGALAHGFTVYDRGNTNTVRNLEMYRAVPVEFREHLGAKGAEIYFGTRPVTRMDDLRHLSDQKPSGYSKDQTFAKVAAMVTMRATPLDPHPHAVMAVGGGSKTYGSGSVNVSAHEAAHAIDFTSGHPSHSAEFAALHEQVTGKFMVTPYYVQANDPAQGRAEFFAEAFAAWAVNRNFGNREQMAGNIMTAVGATPFRYGTGKELSSPAKMSEALAAQLKLGEQLAAYYDKLYQDFIKGTG